jgi:hypothetical protein
MGDGPDQFTPSLLVQLSMSDVPSGEKFPTRIQAPAVFSATFNPLAGVHAADGLTGVDHAACAGVAANMPVPTTSAINIADGEANLLLVI